MGRRAGGDSVSGEQTERGGSARAAAGGQCGSANQAATTLWWHSAHAEPSLETTLRRDAGPTDPRGGNCYGISLRYALSTRPTASQGFASGAAIAIVRETPEKGHF